MDLANQASILGEKTKASFGDTLLWALKLFTAMVFGLVFSLIFFEVFRYQTLSFIFVFILTMGVVLRTLWKWSFLNVIIFDLISVLVSVILWMYIHIAP